MPKKINYPPTQIFLGRKDAPLTLCLSPADNWSNNQPHLLLDTECQEEGLVLPVTALPELIAELQKIQARARA